MNIQALQSPQGQAHFLLQEAWYALDKGNYVEAKELADKAHQKDGTKFSDYRIDIEILNRRGNLDQIPEKLREIGILLQMKGSQREAVKAFKRRAKLELPPNPAAYQTVIRLYNGIGKNAKADQWTRELTELLSSGTSSPQTSFVEQAETKQREPSDSHTETAANTFPSQTVDSHRSQTQNPTQGATQGRAKPDSNPYFDPNANLGPKAPLLKTTVHQPQKTSQQSISKTPEENKAPAPPVRQPITAAQRLPKFSKMIFGKEAWEKYVGPVRSEPLLPSDIEAILNSPCPFFSHFFNRKKVYETHNLLYIPQGLNLVRAVKVLQESSRAGKKQILDARYLPLYDDFCPMVHSTTANLPSWVLITKTRIPDCVGKNFELQQSYIYDKHKNLKYSYHCATLTEVLLNLFITYRITNNYGVEESPHSIRCREASSSGRYEIYRVWTNSNQGSICFMDESRVQFDPGFENERAGVFAVRYLNG